MILNIQFFDGDREQAMKLARLIADLQPTRRTDVKVLFTARFDTSHDPETSRYVAEKFPTIEFTCRRNATGWPNGPNQMMGESYSYCVETLRSGKLRDDSVMMIEADCVPLYSNWIDMLMEEHKASGKMVSGAWLTREDCGCEHVNGNCIISLDFWRRCKQIFNPMSRGGWDATLARYILPNAHPSSLIWSDYQLGMDHNPRKGPDFLWGPKSYKSPTNPLYGKTLQPAWFHGIKVREGIDCVRKRLLNESKNKTS